MNRRERRAKVSQAGRMPPALALIGLSRPKNIDDVYAAAMAHYCRREFVPAQSLCREILERYPRHVRSLVLLGDIAQQDGRNKLAVKLLGQALALDCGDAAAHDTIAIAYQALGHRDEAIRHFSQAVAQGLRGPEALVKQSAPIAAPLRRLADAWPRQLGLAELLGAQGAGPIAGESLLLALLQSKVIHDLELERLFTAIRRGLLQLGADRPSRSVDDEALEFFCVLAQQCFLNEYVFAFGDSERAQLRQVHDRVVDALQTGAAIAPLDLVVTASYLPLHKLPLAASLLNDPRPDALAGLLAQQISEPLAEATDREDIPALTPIDDDVSLQVQNQYEENPYPRWTIAASVEPTTIGHYLCDTLGVSPVAWPRTSAGVDFLIAGCGTGSHSIDTARRFPRSRVLAIDISRASLAYARRKTRALGLTNIAYAQADILKLATLDRRFDVIETAGVLHHLADPAAGWRLLLSLLRPNGLMFVGLYSASARRSLTAARDFIAVRGYRATADDIRACRQDLIMHSGMPPFRDFSSTSGCRDLLFNVMEHQFTIPQIGAFLDANHLTFLGFEQLPADVRRQFQEQFPGDAAMGDLASWHSFEQMHPLTFGNMYFFWVQKREAS
jgi:2-polyprenyl-3-methyl-5-hydroxy-6-metoxy-1,4-benzoquinol methylase